MLPHSVFQADFAGSLLSRDLLASIEPEFAGGNGNARFAIYRNNVIKGLCNALGETFPVVKRLVGTEFFEAVAAVFATRQPPSSPALLEYGADFPAFLADFEPTAAISYLADVARLERAWLDAYHSADAEPATALLASLPFESMPGARVALHPSLRIVRCKHAIFDLWLAHRDMDIVSAIQLADGREEAAFIRPGRSVLASRLSPGEADFLEALLDGATILQAAGVGQASFAQFNIAAALKALVARQAIVGLILESGDDRC